MPGPITSRLLAVTTGASLALLEFPAMWIASQIVVFVVLGGIAFGVMCLLATSRTIERYTIALYASTPFWLYYGFILAVSEFEVRERTEELLFAVGLTAVTYLGAFVGPSFRKRASQASNE